MGTANLGSKRTCPNCAAKFYDFGATDPISCPKCQHRWRDGVAKKVKPEKKEAKPRIKPAEDEPLLGDEVDLPEVEDGGDVELEPMDDDGVELASLEEVEEHEEDEESDPNSDDADDEMFAEMVGDEKLVDDLEDHLDEDEDEDETDADDDDEDDESGSTRRRR